MNLVPALAVLLALGPAQAQERPQKAPSLAPATRSAETPSEAMTAQDAGLVAVHPVIDLGKVKAPESRETTFTIYNSNPKTLRITGVSTSCGCTVASPAKSILEPGESTTVTAKFSSQGFFGPLTRTITLRTDDPAHPVLELNLKVQVDAAYILMPHNLFLMTKCVEHGGTLQAQEFRFAPVSTIYKPKSVHVEPTTTPLKVTWTSAAGGEVKGKITLDPATLGKDFWATDKGELNRARLVLETEEGPSSYMDILWQVQPRGLEPGARVNLGILKANTPFTRSVTFNPMDGKTPFRILTLASSNPALKVETPIGTREMTHSLQITSQGMKPGAFREFITITTDTDPGPLTVPIIGVAE